MIQYDCDKTETASYFTCSIYDVPDFGDISPLYFRGLISVDIATVLCSPGAYALTPSPRIKFKAQSRSFTFRARLTRTSRTWPSRTWPGSYTRFGIYGQGGVKLFGST
jgi:hypothetical protein